MFKKMLLWITANAILPILVPAIFLSALQWFREGTFPLDQIFMDLIRDGFYIFSAMALLFSLFEDYSVFKHCTSALSGVLITLFVLCTCGIFYFSMSDPHYMENNLSQFSIIWGSSALYAGILKYRQLKYRKNNSITD